ncbi:FecR domain-containing protein [Actimicrobium sp. CCI2.3]|uniref:FecR domain-containing protein n=1 Tax=Actimicrobium sp. CCI2.3 TaxID=3048616 RepID=UPI002AB3DA70|nr:FecR domain-containing protein [Actimicrobium sp. CCI2.3]MDY7573400.1 FecR domain-containing protein [Actimicrobium sp. CCI2.3]MEB0021798.1 FecR domain-containing protein [Actimicrobium sp. CCI2.3]
MSASDITVTARQGDTLSSIASQFTKATSNWIAIGKLNHISKDTSVPVGSAIVIPASLLPDEPGEARVIMVSGKVTAMGTDKQSVKLKVGSQLTEGMQIETASNSFLTLGLSDASRVSLPSNTRIRLSVLRMARYTRSPRTEITILGGKVESQISPLAPSMGRFEIRTPLAMAGVRGTYFRVGLLADGTTATELLSGAVEVSRRTPGPGVTLQAGQGNIVSAAMAGLPVALLEAPQLNGQAAMLPGRIAQFKTSTLAGAKAYHLQISTDARGEDLFAETRSTGNPIQLGGIDAGDYFVRISAIDAMGLEGFSRIVPVSLRPPPSAESPTPIPSAPTVDFSDSRQFQLSWRSPTAAGFNLQVARDVRFSWLQFNTTSKKPLLMLPRPPFGTYFTRVQIRNSDGSTGPYSATQSFVVTDQWIIHEGEPIASQSDWPR